jgi:hypothetical protein
MMRTSRTRLKGTVEVDKTFIGGTEKNVHGRQTITKALVVIAVEVEEKNLGQIRFRIIHDTSGEKLMPFIKENISPDSVVITDGGLGYAPLKKNNYVHSYSEHFPKRQESLRSVVTNPSACLPDQTMAAGYTSRSSISKTLGWFLG